MNNTRTGNNIKRECVGYISPRGIDAPLETRVHFDRMRYPGGFMCETIEKLTYVLIYDKCATMEEKLGVIRTYPNTTDVCTYLKYIRDRNSNRVARVYDLSEN